MHLSVKPDHGHPDENPFVRNLANLVVLSRDDEAALLRAVRRERVIGAHTTLGGDGAVSAAVPVVLKGFACRYTHPANGRRQILSFPVPGDLGDVDFALYGHPDAALATLTACRVAEIPSDVLRDLVQKRPRVGQALRIDKFVAEAGTREWLISLGSRTASQRVAHLLVELWKRLDAVGRAEHDGCDLPITQADLADAMGLSAVHINRALQTLRARRLIEWRGKRFRIPDLSRLHRFAAATLDDIGPIPARAPVPEDVGNAEAALWIDGEDGASRAAKRVAACPTPKRPAGPRRRSRPTSRNAVATEIGG